EACLAHWRGTHAAIGARLPGVRAYVQNHGVLSDGRFLLPYPGFDIMPELDWDDLGAMDVAIDSPIHERDSIDDEANFIDTARTGYAVTTRHVLREGDPPSGAVKLITLLRRAPNASTHAQLYRELLEQAEAIETVGLDSMWISEHHFAEDGYMPAVLPIAAALVARTKRIVVGTDRLATSLHSAVRLAEDAVSLDLLSGG